MCFLSTTFPNAPAHPPILFDQSLINHDCKTSCGLNRDGLLTNWKIGFDSDPRLHDLKLSMPLENLEREKER